MTQHIAIDDLDLSEFIRPGDNVLWGQAAAEPVTLTHRLSEQRDRVGPLNIFLGMSYGKMPDLAWCSQTRFSSYCGTGHNKRLVLEGRLDILPCHYSALPRILSGKVDVLLLQLASGHPEGSYSLGLAHEYLLPLIDRARVVIAEVSAKVPFTHGEREITESDIDVLVMTDRSPIEVRHAPPGRTELEIARNVDGLIDDGATLQLGLGSLPETILSCLSARNLGIHSGLIGDKVAELMQTGVITNDCKAIDAGKNVAGLMIGTRRLYDFAHRNKAILLRGTNYTHALSKAGWG